MPCKFWGWGPDPQIWGGVELGGQKMVPFKSVLLVSYLLPIVTKALSLTVFAQLSNVTDGQNYNSNSDLDAAR